MYGKFIFFPCLYVWQILLSEVLKDVGTSNVYGNSFPECSIGIYFFSALERILYSPFYCLEDLFFFLAYVWQVFLSDGAKDVETSNLYENLFFPIYSIEIYFSSAIVRLCYWSYPLLHVSDKCNTSTAEAVIEDYVRYSCMHTSDMSLVILPATPFFWIRVRDDLRKCI